MGAKRSGRGLDFRRAGARALPAINYIDVRAYTHLGKDPRRACAREEKTNARGLADRRTGGGRRGGSREALS